MVYQDRYDGRHDSPCRLTGLQKKENDDICPSVGTHVRELDQQSVPYLKDKKDEKMIKESFYAYQ